MVPATFTSSLFIGTASRFASGAGLASLAFAVMVPEFIPKPFFNWGSNTNWVIAKASTGIATTVMIRGSQLLKPPEDGVAAPAVGPGAAASSPLGADCSIRLTDILSINV